MSTRDLDGLSPWAKRYGPYKQLWAVDADGVRRSTLAPALPDVDPIVYYDILGINLMVPNGCSVPIHKPSDAALDELFVGERRQQSSYLGAKSRQLGALNTRTFLGPSGHTALENDNLGCAPFCINESQWFNFMQRSRWYREELIYPSKLVNAYWFSADDDNIWSHLKWPFELAYRILNLLIQEQQPYLDMIVFGNVEVEEEPPKDGMPAKLRSLKAGESLPGQAANRRIFVHERPLDKRSSPDNLRSAIDNLTRNVIWSFTDEDDCVGDDGRSCYGSTRILNPELSVERQGPILISLSTSLLRGLVEGTVTHAEAMMMYFQTALVILHETMHALWTQRWFCGYHAIEPFVNNDEMCELGCAFEKEIFGGRLLHLEGNRALRNGIWHGRCLGLRRDDWPNVCDAESYTRDRTQNRRRANDLLQCREGVKLFSWPIPAFWPSWLFTTDFWDTVVVSYGSKALKTPQILYAPTEIWRMANRTFRLRSIEPRSEVKELIPLLRDTLERMHSREEKFKILRPWQAIEYSRWSATPWSWIQARHIINDFSVYHAQRNFKKAASRASHLYAVVATATRLDQETSGAALQWSPTYCVFGIIAGLMFTALPLLDPLPAKSIKLSGRMLTPTHAAINSHPYGSAQMLQNRPILEAQRQVHTIPAEPSFSANIPFAYLPITKPLDIVKRIHDMVTQWKARLLPIHLLWYNSVSTALSELDIFRQSRKARDLWGPWNFRIPNYAYDESHWVRYCQQQNKWEYATDLHRFAQGFNPSPPITTAPLPVQQNLITYPIINSPVLVVNSAPILPPSDTPLVPQALERPIEMSRETSPFTQFQYYTIASAADHGWIVDPSPCDSTMDLYDLKALSNESGFENVRAEDVTFCGPHGRQLLPGQDRLRASLRDQRVRCYMGKLLRYYRIEEVLEFDGRNNTPIWVVGGDKIFDTTECQSVDLKKPQCAESRADSSSRALDQDGIESGAGGSKNIQPFQVGFLQVIDRLFPDQKSVFHMTAAMLRRYDNPTDGLYTAINGYVYDLSDYIDKHPGGIKICSSIFGHDGTEAFLKHHSIQLLKQPEFAVPRVGRLIKGYRKDDIGINEIAIHEFIFDIKDICSQDQGLHELLKPFYGLDVTHILTGTNDCDKALSDRMTTFYISRTDLIVGRFHLDTSIDEVTMDDVKQHSSVIDGAWVVVADDVFNITTLLLHLNYYADNPGLTANSAGKIITDVGIAEWLKGEHSHRIFAKIGLSRHESVSSLDLDAVAENDRADIDTHAHIPATRKKRKANETANKDPFNKRRKKE